MNHARTNGNRPLGVGRPRGGGLFHLALPPTRAHGEEDRQDSRRLCGRRRPDEVGRKGGAAQDRTHARARSGRKIGLSRRSGGRRALGHSACLRRDRRGRGTQARRRRGGPRERRRGRCVARSDRVRMARRRHGARMGARHFRAGQHHLQDGRARQSAPRTARAQSQASALCLDAERRRRSLLRV